MRMRLLDPGSEASLPLEEAVMVNDGRWEAYETAYNARRSAVILPDMRCRT